MSIIKKNNNEQEIYSFRNQFNDLVDSFFGDSIFNDSFFSNTPSLAKTAILPKVNVSENENEYIIDAELPGVSKENIEVSYQDNMLNLKAERKDKHEDKKQDYYRVESSFGSVQRSIHIPKDIKNNEIDAKFEDGILTITLPKAKKEKIESNKIEIK